MNPHDLKLRTALVGLTAATFATLQAPIGTAAPAPQAPPGR